MEQKELDQEKKYLDSREKVRSGVGAYAKAARRRSVLRRYSFGFLLTLPRCRRALYMVQPPCIPTRENPVGGILRSEPLMPIGGVVNAPALCSSLVEIMGWITDRSRRTRKRNRWIRKGGAREEEEKEEKTRSGKGARSEGRGWIKQRSWIRGRKGWIMENGCV